MQSGARELGAQLSLGKPGPIWLFPIPFTISLMPFWYDGFVWSARRG